MYSVIRSAKPPGGNTPNGLCDFDGLKLYIKKGLKKSIAQETLLHEVLHACTSPLLNGEEQLSDEKFVTGVSPVLLQVMRDNPKLLEYLTQ